MPHHFLPRQSGAHRIACIALYRALLLQCARITLPVETFRGPVNPIKHQIRKQFRLNQHDTSSRLVVSALKLGYEAEELLRNAGDGEEAANANILSLLRKIHAQSDVDRPRLANIPKPPRIPYLGDTRYPGAPLTLNVRPRPLSELSGRRHIPVLASANKIPFLRFKKPQSAFLSRVIGDKIKQRQRRLDNIDKVGTLAEWGYDEDEWDDIVQEEREWNESPWFVESQWQKRSIETLIHVEETRASKKAKQMLVIVGKEQALADQERTDRRVHKSRDRRERRDKETREAKPAR